MGGWSPAEARKAPSRRRVSSRRSRASGATRTLRRPTTTCDSSMVAAGGGQNKDETYTRTESARCMYNDAITSGCGPCATNSADRNRHFFNGDSHVLCAAPGPKKASKYCATSTSPTPMSLNCGLAFCSASRTNALLAGAGLGVSNTTLHFWGCNLWPIANDAQLGARHSGVQLAHRRVHRTHEQGSAERAALRDPRAGGAYSVHRAQMQKMSLCA